MLLPVHIKQLPLWKRNSWKFREVDVKDWQKYKFVLYSMARVIEIGFYTGFKFSSPWNIHWFMKSGLENLTTKRNRLSGVWKDSYLKRLQSAGGHVEHFADKTVSNLQLPGKPSRGWAQPPAGAAEPLSSWRRRWRNQTWRTGGPGRSAVREGSAAGPKGQAAKRAAGAGLGTWPFVFF